MSSKSELKWELGLFGASVSELSKAETIDLLSEAGYQWIEWRVQSREGIESSPWGPARNTLVIDDLDQEVEEILPLLKDAGIGVCGLQVDPLEEIPDLKNKVIGAAQALDCPRVLLTGLTYDPAVGYFNQRDRFRRVISSWVKAAAGTGVKICVENHMWTILPSTALIVDVIKGYKDSEVGVMWDPANGYWEGFEVPAMALDLLDSFLEEVHFKNGAWKRSEDGGWAYDWCDISEGMVDWPQVLEMLEKSGYQGPLVVEDYRPLDPAEKLAKGREGLEKAQAKVKD